MSIKTFSSKRRNLIIAEIALIFVFAVFTALRLEGVDGIRPLLRVRPNAVLPKDAQIYLKLADQSYEDFDLSKASLNYWYALKKEPDLIKPHVRLSQIFFHENNWNDDAMIQINRALEKDPNNAQAHLIRGRLFRDEGLIDEAAKEYETVIKLDPNNVETHYRLGLVYQAVQLSDFAVEEYKLAIDADKDLTQPMFEKKPFGLQARLALARVYKNVPDKLDDAIELLKEIYDKDQDYEVAKQTLISLLYTKAHSLQRIAHLRLYGESLKIYDRILEIDPTEIDAWKWIGQIHYFYTQDYEKALEAYSKAFEIDPGDIDVLANIKVLKQFTEKGKE